MAKTPMQFFSLFIGAMVFVFFIFAQPPVLFQPVELRNVQSDPRFRGVEKRYEQAFEERKDTAEKDLASKNTATLTRYQNAQRWLDKAQAAGEPLAGKDFLATQYI